VREFKATGTAYRQQLHTVMKSAYRSHFASAMLDPAPRLPRSSTQQRNALSLVLDALAIVKQYAGSRLHTHSAEINIPIESTFGDHGRRR